VDPATILKYLDHPFLPVVILVVFCGALYYILKQERTRHCKTREKLDDVYSRLEQRLYHELDELERILREERARLR